MQEKYVHSQTLSIKNCNGWEISFHRIAADRFTFNLVDPWGIAHRNIDNVIIANQAAEELVGAQMLSEGDRQILLVNLLHKRMQSIIDTNHRHGLMVETINDQFHIIFDQYGLAGGGPVTRALGVATGAAQVGGGIALIVFTLGWGALAGSALLSSGINGCVFSATADDEDFTFKEFAKTSLAGAAAGAISGGVAAGASAFTGNLASKGAEAIGQEVVKKTGYALAKEVAVQTAKTVATDAAIGATTTVLSTVAEEVILQDGSLKQLSAKKIALGAASSAISGQIGAVAKKVTKKGVANSFKTTKAGAPIAEVVQDKVTRKAVNVATGAAANAGAGAASAATSKLAENYFNGEELTKDLAPTVVIGATVKAMIGGAKAHKVRADKQVSRKEFRANMGKQPKIKDPNLAIKREREEGLAEQPSPTKKPTNCTQYSTGSSAATFFKAPAPPTSSQAAAFQPHTGVCP